MSDTALCPWWKKRSEAERLGEGFRGWGLDQGLGWCWGRGWAERSEVELGYCRGMGGCRGRALGRAERSGAKRSEAEGSGAKRMLNMFGMTKIHHLA